MKSFKEALEEQNRERYKDKTVYMWRMVFKGTSNARPEKLQDWQTGQYYQDLGGGLFHDFKATNEEADAIELQWFEAGYEIRDTYNLGKYGK